MPIFDELPKPVQKAEHHPEHPLAQIQFAHILNGFALVYHFLHKFLMPIFVIYTSSLPTPSVEKIDWWWLYHVLLFLCLRYKKMGQDWFRGVLTFGYAGLTIQFLESFHGKSWHSLSLWLTAGTTLLVLLYLQKILPPVVSRAQKYFLIWGLICGVCVEGSLYFFYGRHPYVADLRTETPSQVKPVVLDSASQVCGVKAFAIPVLNHNLVLPELKTLTQLDVGDCGLPFALARTPKDTLSLLNKTQDYMNFKLSYWDGVKWQSYKNIPLPKGARKSLQAQDLSYEVILMSSDARPQVGILVLLQNEESLQRALENGAWHAKEYVTVSKEGLK